MAKTGFWLQGAKGKLAGTTIYQQNGETVIREINRAPSNPQTTSQIVQRIIMHTVMQAYSKMKEICDHSFEGIKAGQAGPVSFVGLAVPHIARLLFATDDHRLLLPATLLTGALVALFCNLLCFLPGDSGIIPLNAVPPLVGAPVVIYVIMKGKHT